MPWQTKLATTFNLKDGRVVETLTDARKLILALPKGHAANEHWIYAAELLIAAADATKRFEIQAATVQLGIALRAEGLL